MSKAEALIRKLPDWELGRSAAGVLATCGVNDVMPVVGNDWAVFGRCVRETVFTEDGQAIRPKWQAVMALLGIHAIARWDEYDLAVGLMKAAAGEAFASHAFRTMGKNREHPAGTNA